MAPPKKRRSHASIEEAEAALLPSQIEEIRKQAKAKVKADAEEAAKKKLLDAYIDEERRAVGLDEPIVSVTIDLAPYCDRILLDNVAFFQGKTYTVPVSQAAVMWEQMQRTWNHQSEIDGKSENFYRKTRGARVVPVGEDGAAVINTTALLRA